MPLFRRLLILAIVIAAFGCRSSDPIQPFVDSCSGGYLGNADPSSPLVCVGVSGSTATPRIDPVHAYPKSKNGKAVQIVWASADPSADLHLTVGSSQNCVKGVACPRKKACTAIVVETAAGGTQCEYQLSNGGGKPIDPIIIIDTCCPDQ